MATISGDFGTVNIPDFALDSTLQALLAEQNETRAAMVDTGGAISSLQSSVENVGSSSNAGNQIQSNIRTTLIRTQRQAQSQSQQQLSTLQRLRKDLNLRQGVLQAARTGDPSQILTNMGGKIGAFANFLVDGFKGTIKILGDYRNSIQNLTNVGQGFGQSILTLQKDLGRANMGLAEFERVVSRNGTAIANLGENSGKSFAQLSNQVQNSASAFGNYGLKITEINDFLAENLEIERMSGAVGKEASDNAAAAFNALAKETTLQSIQTGRDRKAMMRAALEARSSENFLAAVRQEEAEGNTEAAKNMRQNLNDVTTTLSAMFGPELAGQLVDSITTGVAEGRGIEATEVGRQFLAAGGPAAEALQKIALNFKNFSPDEVGNLLMDFQGQIEERAEGIKDLGRLANVNEGFGLLRSLFVNLTKVEDLSADEIEARLKERAEASKVDVELLKTERTVNKLMVAAQGELANIVNELSGNASGIARAFETVNNSMNLFADFIRPDKLSGIFASGGNSASIASSLEGKGMLAAAFGFRQAGREGALQAAAMSQQLGKQYTISGNDVLDAQGNKLSSRVSGGNTIFKGADGTEFFNKGGKLVPIKSSIMSSLAKTGGKYAGAGGLAITSAIDAYKIESGIGGNIDRLKKLKDTEGITEEEKTKIDEQIEQERAKYYKQYAQLADKLIMGGLGASMGSILGGGLGSIPLAVGGSYAGMSMAESGLGPMQWLANMLGVSPDEMKSTDRSKLLKRIKEADTEMGDDSTDDGNSMSKKLDRTNELLGALVQGTEFQTATLKKGMGSQQLVS